MRVYETDNASDRICRIRLYHRFLLPLFVVNIKPDKPQLLKDEDYFLYVDNGGDAGVLHARA